MPYRSTPGPGGVVGPGETTRPAPRQSYSQNHPAMLLGEGAVVNEKQLIEPPDVHNLLSDFDRPALARDRRLDEPVLLR